MLDENHGVGAVLAEQNWMTSGDASCCRKNDSIAKTRPPSGSMVKNSY